ncbi:transcriptional repressor LexA [Clostridium perfringens]|uniref:LexA repressor n=3 Tax=Clostridium perfringens TaxID=1502 RepID=LEXA_CLOPE|nr:transcriptional repressor LexA [Clostridium perfringens]Q8XL81.1 RecName: Full=LexA repressor [Clostridium perfringens str. 13]ALG48700.1 SOS-response repressor and protease LexA [Clostridium perfringens]EDT13257.1 LexA repressor [Clostridium perfringens E str. JGS1987]EGT0000817.1 transcriptional repressor LexA [Clostridium perfringens]EGT0692851.1 transcriptional repressor LexA [Clostridium perfringens]EGT5618431.1 transcriptional repressor LexA [Clostridium perfringens]
MIIKENSDKQTQIYNFLIEFTKSKGYPPSVREICQAVSLKSTSTVHGHLKRLEKKGLIYRDPTKPRALEIVELSNEEKELIDIPIVGKVTAGMPILATENIEDMFQMPINYVKHNNDLFILKVTGDSMIEAGILDGDLAIIEQKNVATNGDIVVALIENEATIKRFFKENGFIRLQPENKNYEPIIVEDCSILGKLVGIYRAY